MSFKEVISDVRKNKGLSQDEMAEKLYVTRQAVSRWENGDTMPNIETLKTISREFNIPAGELLELDDGAVCQSCGMDLKSAEDLGTFDNGEVHTEYCTYCFQKGSFTSERTVEEMVESNLRFLDEYNAEKGVAFTPEEARRELTEHLKTLKRWRQQ